MKQIIQDLKLGKTILEEVPAPIVRSGHVLIKSTYSLVSLGTERMLVEFGRANLLDKARQQPDKVKMVLDKVKSDGLLPTLESVFNKLNQPLPLGYCNVGEVIAVGSGVDELKVGDRVASNGHHAEFVCVPKNLVAKVPDNVSNEEAAFTVIGAIGLQGIRLINPTFGETVVVVGLGLIGLITAELLRSNGCNVVGLDFDSAKVGLAKKMGIDALQVSEGIDPVKYVLGRTGVGADGVVITASAKTDEVISQAARMSRKRGRIVLVGVVGLNISRADFYEKELSFQVSCSYGPGRYDEDYEQKGKDYPLPYVRWTEKRNFEAVLKAISNDQLHVKALISEICPLEDYQKIYSKIGDSKAIASLLKYNTESSYRTSVKVQEVQHNGNGKECIGIIGAGNFTNAVILPALSKAKMPVKYIASAGGLSSVILSKKYGVARATSDYKEILNDDDVGSVVVSTRHNLHSEMVVESLKARKHVFVEKPLALAENELTEIISCIEESGKSVIVGYNRRFSPHMIKIKQLIGPSPELNIIATMNAGFIPANSWVHSLDIGGGRIVGEACHYFDLLIYLTGSPIKAVCMNSLGIQPLESTDNASILLKFENGSNGVINYFSNGSKTYSKERIEVYYQEKTLISDNFRKTLGYGFKDFSSLSTKQDKGHKEQFKQLSTFWLNGGSPIIPLHEIINSTKSVFAAVQSLKEGRWVEVK